MLIKLDENLSIAHVNFLRDEGYDCDRATDEGYLVKTTRLYGSNLVLRDAFLLLSILIFLMFAVYHRELTLVFYCCVPAMEVVKQCLIFGFELFGNIHWQLCGVVWRLRMKPKPEFVVPLFEVDICL